MSQTEKKQPEKKNFLRSVLGLVLEVAVLWIVFHYIIFFAYVPTTSMVPTIPKKSVMLVTYLHGDKKVERGDAVVFWSEEYQERMVKRVVGLPGETVVIEEGTVLIDGVPLDEPYVKYQDELSAEFHIPEDCYLFLGDNRNNSEDARWWDNPYISSEDLIGKAQILLWPLTEISLIR